MRHTIVLCFLVALLAVGAVRPAKLSLRLDGGGIVWKNDAGEQVASLRRRGQAIELDAPLYAQNVSAGNVSILSALAEADQIIANLTAEVQAVRAMLADLQQDSNPLSAPWRVNSNWFDMAATVHPRLVGFFDGFATADHVYHAPYRNDTEKHGVVVRVSTSDFSSSGVEWFDLAAVDGALVGFHGGFAAGGFAYYAPYRGSAYHGNVVRINISDFSPSGVEWFDLETTVDAGLVGFNGAFALGKFAYYAPYVGFSGTHGHVARINMSNFTSGGVEWFDLTSVFPGLNGFRGGFAGEDNFAYLVPSQNGSEEHGRAVRIDASNFSAAGVQWFNMATVHTELVGFRGGFAAEGFAYYVPYKQSDNDANGRVVRVSMSDFSPAGLEWFDLTSVHPKLAGFHGGATGGGYAYYAPYTFGLFVRIKLSDFSLSGTEWFDADANFGVPGGTLRGYHGVAVAGDFMYYTPYDDGSDYFGRVLRIPIV